MQKLVCEECNHLCTEHVPFLAVLPVEEQKHIIARANHKRYKKDDNLFLEGFPAEYIWIIHSGKVKLSHIDGKGREQIISILMPGDTVWEGMLEEGSVYSNSGVCMEESNVCAISIREIKQTLSNPKVALRVIDMLSHKLEASKERARILTSPDPLTRLAGLLLTTETQDGDTVSLRLDDMAGTLGIRPETVSRKLRVLIDDGLIERTGQSTIRITDREKLQEFFES